MVEQTPGMPGTFSRHRLQMRPQVSDPGMHHSTCVTHVPWCMSGSLTRGGGENVCGISAACPTRNFAYLARGPWRIQPCMGALWLAWFDYSCAINSLPRTVTISQCVSPHSVLWGFTKVSYYSLDSYVISVVGFNIEKYFSLSWFCFHHSYYVYVNLSTLYSVSPWARSSHFQSNASVYYHALPIKPSSPYSSLRRNDIWNFAKYWYRCILESNMGCDIHFPINGSKVYS